MQGELSLEPPEVYPVWPRGILAEFLACSVLIGTGSARGQAGMTGMQMKAIPALEQLPAPVKMTGIGNSHFAITAAPEAQAWFDQGLNTLHDFWDYESAKAFEQGIQVAPNCAMCYWGLYQALMFRGDGPTADSGLPKVQHARHFLAEHQSSVEAQAISQTSSPVR